MKRVVITGMGITSCLGNDLTSVRHALENGTSGIKLNESFKEAGMRSHISGDVDVDLASLIDRKLLRFMGGSAAYAYLSMKDAIEDSGLTHEQVSNERTGIVAGSGGASSSNLIEAADELRNRGIKRVGPYRVTRTMGSAVSACLATPFEIKGVNYSISSACATSAHCIGHAMELIQMGKQDVVFAGGSEENDWTLACLFDGMGALSTNNDHPESASCPYDQDRDGFVIAGGAGMVVVEELEHAKQRGARIYAEIVGYGATSDGYNMVAPSGEGAVRCMKQAMSTVDGPIDYINAHGTSTPAGDLKELEGVISAFDGMTIPKVSSTKSLSGHSLGAAGVQEAIYSLLMMQHNFIAASANISTLDENAQDIPIVTTTEKDVTLNRIMSNSFGFGGTNASLVFQRYKDDA
ncbi:MAG: beta-ketoacyl-ACP synthase I [Pseudomonadota bacterium]